jgi:hypothetical protein
MKASFRGRLPCRAGIWAAFLFLAASGCAAKGTITGRVTYDGKPLTGGSVIFLDSADRAHPGPIDSQGNYRIENVPVGEVKIALNVTEGLPAMPGGGGRGAMRWGPPGGQAPAGLNVGTGEAKSGPKKALVSERFKSPEQSGLRYMVISGPQTHNLDLP